MKRQAFIVSHTHWDREWYLTFSRFRVNLVEAVGLVLDRLENDPDFEHFVLDGQTCLLEDYLEVKPQDRERIGVLLASGALAAGPWYILPDEFLVPGEATVRNLIFGRKSCRPLGPVQQVGYMPDSFGHVAQMPQILKLAGIDSFIFTRGLGDEADQLGWLFNWQGPDGSEVLAANQCEGYCNAGGLGQAELWHAHTQRAIDPARAVTRIRELLEQMSHRPGADPILLNNGCDHFPPQKKLGQLVEALNREIPEVDFRQAGFTDFLEAVRHGRDQDELPRYEGEFLGGRDHPILSGVWSARMYLKQQNEACFNLLTRQVEPLLALACFGHGESWPAGLLDDTWRQLLRNHPHDSICGCSTDSVHADMETRFAAVLQTGQQLLSRLLNRISPLFGRQPEHDLSPVITVANGLPYRRDEVIERLLVLPAGHFDPDQLQLVDDTGRPVPFRIRETRYLERFWGIDYRGELFVDDQLDMLDTYLHRFGHRIIGTAADSDTHDCFLLIQFQARDLPAVGVRHYRLLARSEAVAEAAPEPRHPVRATRRDDGAILENDFLRLRLHPDGTFDLHDRENDRWYNGLNLLEDSEDTGDEYDHCPADLGLSVFSGGCQGKVRVTDNTDLKVSAEAAFRFDLPRSLEKDRSCRHPRTTPCDVTVQLTLPAGGRRVEVRTTINNRAFDHRLRVWFPTGLATDQVTSHGIFMLNRRPLKRQGSENWKVPAPATWPQQDWSALHDGNFGLAIFNRGLPEFETWTDPQGGTVFALTLLRCVDWLSRDDLATRNNINAGPTLHTPGAQCIGRQVFNYAVAPFAGDPLNADLIKLSETFRSAPVTHQGVADQMRPGGLSLVAKTDPRVALTAIKRAEQGHQLEVRLVNLATEEVRETLQLGIPVKAAHRTDLLGKKIAGSGPAIDAQGHRVDVTLGPCEIATIALELDPLPTISGEET